MKTLIFDYDGVILDSFNTVLKSLNILHKKYNLSELTEEKLRDLFDGNFWENHALLGLDEESEKNFKSELKEMLEQSQSEMPFFPGMKEIIRKLAKDYRLIVLSSNHAENIQLRLKEEGMLDVFEDILGTETPGNKREKIQKILSEKSEQVFFVTDTRGDITEVKNLPIKVIAVAWGYHSKDRLASEKPDIMVDQPLGLLEYLQDNASIQGDIE